MRSRVSSGGGVSWTPGLQAQLAAATPMFTPLSAALGPSADGTTPRALHPAAAAAAAGSVAAFEGQQHALSSTLGALQAASQKGANR